MTYSKQLDDVFERMQEGELKAPYELQSEEDTDEEPDDSEPEVIRPSGCKSGAGDVFRRPGGRLPSVCVQAVAIRRSESVVTDIEFSTGLVLSVPEAVELQDSGAIVLRDLQLIHPESGNPYFRSNAYADLENNFENLPTF